MAKAVFKTYSQDQSYLIPPTWDEKIRPNHPVRIVDRVINSLNLKGIYESYEGGGTSSYDPRMLLKTLIYAYITNIYSSRKIEEAVRSNIYFIWLCGGNEPDHNTINRFRGKRIEPYIKDIFKQTVLLLVEEGLLTLKDIYVDGTKIEANANRYTFVWGKTVKKNKEKLLGQIDELWAYSQKLAAEELNDTEPLEFHSIDSEKVKQTVARIEEAIKGKTLPKEFTQKLKAVKKNTIPKIEEYEAKEKTLNGRNSFSKTDHDATFMRSKEDRMGNQDLKPAYNIQISTNNQVITNYDIYPNPADTQTFISHIDNFISLFGHAPNSITADSGYGSVQNYEYLEQNDIDNYVKYNYFYQDQQGTRISKYPFLQDYLFYNSEHDYFICPMGQHMHKVDGFTRENESGYQQTVSVYEAQNCRGCPLRGVCHKSDDNRKIEVNHKLIRYKKQAMENLTSHEGLRHRRQRSVDVETVFGNIKHNKKFRRFSLRGKKKVATEFGLVALAHNLMKLSV